VEDGKKRDRKREKETERSSSVHSKGDKADERHLESNTWEKKNLISPFVACYFAWLVIIT